MRFARLGSAPRTPPQVGHGDHGRRPRLFIPTQRRPGAALRSLPRKREHVDPQVWAVEAFIRLHLVGALADRGAQTLDTAVKARVCAARPQVVAVVLGLHDTTAIDDNGCTRLGSLRRDLATMRIQLRLALRGNARRRLERSGMLPRIGADAIHPTVRVGVLAAYETVPGPAVVTPAIRNALTQPPETLMLEPAEAINDAVNDAVNGVVVDLSA